jgi:hypothetical protein
MHSILPTRSIKTYPASPFHPTSHMNPSIETYQYQEPPLEAQYREMIFYHSNLYRIEYKEIEYF